MLVTDVLVVEVVDEDDLRLGSGWGTSGLSLVAYKVKA